MARPLRLEFAGALYHITSRGDRREDIYENDNDRTQFLTILGDVCQRFNWHCHAYCLMSNHYHLLIETPDANLSRGMRQLNGVYTLYFNRTHGRVGHVFQGRYKGIIVDKNNYLLELARYIVLNPVRAAMVRTAKDWSWSSYRATAGMTECQNWLQTDWLLAAFAKRKSTAIEKYKQFIGEGKGQASPWKLLRNQVYLGDEPFVEKMLSLIDGNRNLSEIPASQRRPPPKPLAVYETEFTSRDDTIVAIYLSGAYTLQQIGEHFGLHYSRISRIIKEAKGKT